jgi:phosphohistidine phosphatase SixA
MSGVEVRMIRSRLAFAGCLASVLLMAIPAVHGGPPGAPCPADSNPTGTDPAAIHAVVIYLVRHAEKASGSKDGGKDPGLTEAGRARALALARTLNDAGIDTIYSTDFKRTRETVAPLAERLGVAIRIYDWNAMEALATDLRHAGGRHLVVGHSDTTPELVGILGGEPGPAIDEGSEHDRLYVVTIGPSGAVTTSLLRYGEPLAPDRP